MRKRLEQLRAALMGLALLLLGWFFLGRRRRRGKALDRAKKQAEAAEDVADELEDQAATLMTAHEGQPAADEARDQALLDDVAEALEVRPPTEPDAAPAPSSKALKGLGLLVALVCAPTTATASATSGPTATPVVKCPTPPPAQPETWRMSPGCPSPWPGRLYSLEAHEKVRRQFAALDELVAGLQRQRDEARAQAAEGLRHAADEIRALTAAVEAIPEPAESSAPSIWPWAAAGGLAVALPVAGGELGEAPRSVTAASAAASLAAVALVAWLLED